MDNFVYAIAGDLDEAGKCEWIFSPSHLRKVFHKEIQKLEEYEEIINES